VLIAILAIFLFPQKARADALICECSCSANNNTINYCMCNLSSADKAFIIFDNLFSNRQTAYIPNGIEIIYVMFDSPQELLQPTDKNRHLILNLSEESLIYGGSYYEEKFIEQIIKTARKIPDVSHITILINNRKQPLIEGREVFMLEI
jgi:hypothetical protein